MQLETYLKFLYKEKNKVSLLNYLFQKGNLTDNFLFQWLLQGLGRVANLGSWKHITAACLECNQLYKMWKLLYKMKITDF